MAKIMKAQPLSQTDSIEKLGQFWDTHDLTDFENQMEEVKEPVFERESAKILKIHLRPQEAEAVKRMAEAREVDQETLIREWVIEKLHEE